jgi:shikimate kinase
MTKLFLIGLPGSGKTTIGKELAKELNIPFVDLDLEIEKLEGMPVREIFSHKKEDYYRQVESAQLKWWCTKSESFVMATGGGAPCFFDNMEAINKSGKSIFLDVSAREITKRMMKTNIAERPLLASTTEDEVKDRIEFLRSHRLAFYKQAHVTIKGDQINLAQLLDKIKS